MFHFESDKLEIFSIGFKLQSYEEAFIFHIRLIQTTTNKNTNLCNLHLFVRLFGIHCSVFSEIAKEKEEEKMIWIISLSLS